MYEFNLILLNSGSLGLPFEYQAAVEAAMKKAAEETMKRFGEEVVVKTGYMESH